MVNFHVGKVLKILKPGKDIVSRDSSVQAVIEMWDKNKLVLTVDPVVAAEVAVSDIVLVDYNPMESFPQPIPKQQVTKVLKGKVGKECWEMFEKFFNEKNNRKQQSQEGPEPQIPGISYSR